MKTRKKQNTNDWHRAWVIGRWNKDENAVEYMRVRYNQYIYWSTDLLEASYVGAGAMANKMVETNIIDTLTIKSGPIIKPTDRKRYQLFTCKIFRNEYNGDCKLTKQTAFHLMEIVANNI